MFADADDAILIDALPRHLLDGDDVGLVFQLARGVHHLRETAARVLDEDIRQEQRERLAPDQFARAPYRVTKPERLLLPGKTRRPGDRQVMTQELQRLVLLPLEQRHLQLELAVEMILDDALVAAGDEDEMLDSRLAGFVHDVLDERPVDDRQHLLRHGLGRRQKASAEPGDGEHGFADGFFHGAPWSDEDSEGEERYALMAKCRSGVSSKFLSDFISNFISNFSPNFSPKRERSIKSGHKPPSTCIIGCIGLLQYECAEDGIRTFSAVSKANRVLMVRST